MRPAKGHEAAMPQDDVQFLDTNIFIRYFTGDDPDKGRRAYALLQRIESGELAATTSEGVLLELIFVLSGKRTYNRPRDEIRQKLVDVLGLKGLRFRNKGIYLRALELFAANEGRDFVDCLNVAHMEHAGIRTIWTFDKDYNRIKGATFVPTIVNKP
jgi:predicted nucleic acid-binding protein